MDANGGLTRVPLVAATRGPIVLIVVGVLFALDYSAGIGIGKTWPILLIVVGVLHLLGRVRAPHASAGQAGDGNTKESRP